MAETKDVDDIANAKFIMLSLLRELDLLRAKEPKQVLYQKQIEQLENDLKYYDDKTLLHKVNEIYLPYLQSLMEKNHDGI